jgi:hypothetical protein
MRVRDQLAKAFSDSAREARWDIKAHVNRPGDNHALVHSAENVEYPSDGGRSLAESLARKHGVRPADISISFEPHKG